MNPNQRELRIEPVRRERSVVPKHASYSATVTEVSFGAVAGAALGAIAGPPGIIAGAAIGAAIGVAASVALHRQDLDNAAKDLREDIVIGVFGGTLGVPGLLHPPARLGVYSAASLGMAGGKTSTPAEGPMPADDD